MLALERFIKRAGKDFMKLSNQCGRLFGLLKKDSKQSLLLQYYINQQSQEAGTKHAQDASEEYQKRIPENWSKAQRRIENLLREMTEQYNSEEIFRDSPEYLDISTKPDCSKMPDESCTARIQKDRMSNVTSLKRTTSTLDIKELKDVAQFARNLQKRNRHRVRS